MLDVDRFKKVCGLLGSDQSGERSVAAAKATAMLKDAGLSWEKIVGENGSNNDELVRRNMEILRMQTGSNPHLVQALRGQISALERTVFEKDRNLEQLRTAAASLRDISGLSEMQISNLRKQIVVLEAQLANAPKAMKIGIVIRAALVGIVVGTVFWWIVMGVI